MKEPNGRASRAGLVALFLALLIFASVAVGFAVRLAYLRYTGDFGEGSFAGLAGLPVPILCVLGLAPLLGLLFAVLVTTRAIRRAQKKEETEKESAPDGEEESDSDF